jgi:porphobilinogen synthase
MSEFPIHRMRRLRATPALRELRRETRLSPADFIHPLFVVEDASAAGPIGSMPGIVRHTLETLDREIESVAAAGIPAVLLFGVPAKKSPDASSAVGGKAGDPVVCRAIEKIKKLSDRLAVITDVCLCSYTDHGHCGLIRDNRIDNDATLAILGKMAAAHARAGADLVAPSGMMDGMVAAIRSALDAANGQNTGILSYAVKYASSFYGPFREAAESAPAFGDRYGYQMDPANAREALAEARLDLAEGADALMVKPAMPYLDVIRRVKDAFPEVPLAAYQVSGEYSMMKAAAAHGWLDERKVALESLTAIKRAGADTIITYFALAASGWLH